MSRGGFIPPSTSLFPQASEELGFLFRVGPGLPRHEAKEVDRLARHPQALETIPAAALNMLVNHDVILPREGAEQEEFE